MKRLAPLVIALLAAAAASPAATAEPAAGKVIERPAAPGKPNLRST